MERDFKGIWIPKEIWLSTELTMLEKVILVEIDSLDNENHCTASNEYLAEFCNCSQSKISKAIKHLTDLGLIELLNFDGRHRQLRVVNNDNLHSKKCYAESQKMLSNNIDNNIDNKKVFNKLNTTTEQTFLGSAKKQKQSKQSMYTKCSNIINEFTEDAVIRELLFQFLNMLIDSSKETGTPVYSNVFKGKVNMLNQFPQSQWKRIIQQTLDMGWKGFYALKSNNNFSQSATVNSDHETEEDIKKREEFLARKRANGERTQF